MAIAIKINFKNIEIDATTNFRLSDSFSKSKYVIEEYHKIHEQPSLKNLEFKTDVFKNILGQVTTYNPDKWKYGTFF